MEEKVTPSDDDSGKGEDVGRAEGKPGGKKSDGELKKADKKESRRDAELREERKVREKARKERDEQRAKAPKKKIDFKGAKDAIEVITELQDEKKVPPEKIARLEKFLVEYGDLEAEYVDKMALEEIAVEAQSVLRHAETVTVKEEDIGEGESLAVVQAKAKQAQSKDEETLTEEKVEDYSEVAGAAAEPPKEPPQTAEAAGGDEEGPQDIRDLIARMRDLVKEDRDKDTNPEWQRLSEMLQ